MRSHKEKIQLLKNQIEREKKLRQIVYLSLGLNGCAYTLTRGGVNFIDVDYIQCNINTGLRFLDDKRLINIIHDLYRHKRKGKMIYITTTTLCHLANQYGQTFLALPSAIGDFELTNLYQTERLLQPSY